MAHGIKEVGMVLRRLELVDQEFGGFQSVLRVRVATR
jgi:hypothetical protein